MLQELILIKDPVTKGPAIDWTKIADRYPHLLGVKFPKLVNPKVEMLIGQNCQRLLRGKREICLRLLSTKREICHPQDWNWMRPYARLTPLVWTAKGTTDCPVVEHFVHSL